MKHKLNPEWVKLGPESEVHFMFHPDVLVPGRSKKSLSANRRHELEDRLMGLGLDPKLKNEIVDRIVK